VFSGEELAQLRGFPEITRDELIRFFTLTSANRAFVGPRPWAFGARSPWAGSSYAPKAGWSTTPCWRTCPRRSPKPSGLIGTITVDIDHELAQLDPTGQPRASQAFRRDTSAMTVAADRLYERDRYVRCPPGGQSSGASRSGGDLC
jgi:hypothetical protein